MDVWHTILTSYETQWPTKVRASWLTRIDSKRRHDGVQRENRIQRVFRVVVYATSVLASVFARSRWTMWRDACSGRKNEDVTWELEWGSGETRHNTPPDPQTEDPRAGLENSKL
jgi:hypothetical protein